MRKQFVIKMLLPCFLLFVFLSCEKNSTVTDIDGNVYKTVQIEDQIWMAENLKVTHYRNGDAIPNFTDAAIEWVIPGAYCNYDKDANNATTYGRLYNWYAVNDSRNIAPEGWHVPSDAEWKTLLNYLGGDDVAGGKMKETGTAHWNSPNTGATNESGFSALPGGAHDYNSYYESMGTNAGFWSSTEYDSGNAWYQVLSHNYSEVHRSDYDKRNGFSVRCVSN